MEHTLIGAFGAVAAAITGLTGVLWKLYRTNSKGYGETKEDQAKAVANMARLEARVDVLWEFLLRQSRASALVGGVVTMSSAERISPAAYNYYSPELIQRLKVFYSQNGHLTDEDLFKRIHATFGEDLMTGVCMAHKLHYGSVIVGAMHIAKSAG